MKNLLIKSLCLVLLGWLLPLHSAQAQNFQIVGPGYLCPGECATFALQPITTPFPGTFTWEIYGPNGISLIDTGQYVVICAQFFGPIQVQVSISNSAGGPITTVAETVIFVQDQGPFYQIIADEVTCPNDSTSNCQKVCPGDVVSYTAIEFTGATWPPTWSVTGAESFQVNPDNPFQITVTWGGSGSGMLNAVSQNTLCFQPVSFCVTILETPVADFTSLPSRVGDTITICDGQTVYFQNTSGYASEYVWNFGDGSSSELENPEHEYNTPGLFAGSLIAKTSCHCADTLPFFIRVRTGVAPVVDCAGTVCAGEVITYHTTSGCPSYNWTVNGNGTVIGGGGATQDSITVQWGSGPNGLITLTVAGCGSDCIVPSVVRIPILDDNATIEGPTSVCSGAFSEYSIEDFGGTEFTWTVSPYGFIASGQGTHKIKVQWNSVASASSTVSVNYNNCYLACGGQDQLTVLHRPSFSIMGEVEACAGATENFSARLNSNNSLIASNWTLTNSSGATIWSSASPSGTVSVNIPAVAGAYTLTAIPNDLTQTCSLEETKKINVKNNPLAIASIVGPTIICPGNAVIYEATGAATNYDIVWIVNDGATPAQTKTGETITHAWGNSAPYQVSVKQVTADALACASPSTSLSVSKLTTTTIAGPASICEGVTEAYSIDEDGGGGEVTWTITPANAGVVAEGQGTKNALIFWNKPGNATITATVCGINDNHIVVVHALPIPTAIHPVGICAGATDQVQTSTPYTAYSWLNSDSIIVSTAAMPSIAAGSYRIEVTDANGCVGGRGFEIEEYPTPDIVISTPDPTGFCLNSVDVHITGVNTEDGDFTYQWYAGGAQIANTTQYLVTNQYGTYTLEATNQWGCQALSNPINIFDWCALGGSGQCFNPGAGNCPNSPLTISLTPTAECNVFTLDNTSPAGTYNPGSEVWYLIGPGSPSNSLVGNNVPVTFTKAGYHVIILNAEVPTGPGTSIICEKVDSIRVLLAAGMKVETGCPGTATIFEDISTKMPITDIVSWAWDFGDPASGAANTSTLPDPQHIYNNAGSYTVTLTITSTTGCTSTISKVIEVDPLPVVMFDDPVVVCEATAIRFAPPPGNVLAEQYWDFGDPGSGDANTAQVFEAYHSYDNTGNYTVTLTGTNVFGCTNSFSRNITILSNNLTGAITAAPTSPLCENTTTTLAAPTGGTVWEWSTGETTNAINVATEDIYKVTITDNKGCTYTPAEMPIDILTAPNGTIKAAEMNDLGQLTGYFESPYEVCEGDDVHLVIQANGSYSYQWSSGQTSSSISFTEGHNDLLPVGTHVFSVVITNTLTGCTGTVSGFEVIVRGKPSTPTITAPPGQLCSGASTVLSVIAPSAALTYEWNTKTTGTSVTAEEGGTYYVVASNQYGCKSLSNEVNVLYGPNIQAVPSGCHTRCQPDTLCLPLLPGVISFQWYFNGSPLPAPTGTQKNPIVTQSGAYWVEMVDNQGCIGTSSALELELYDGFGNITTKVWADVNNNGVIDAADTLVANVGISYTGTTSGSGNSATNAAGVCTFTNLLSEIYQIAIIPGTLPSGYSTIIGTTGVTLSGCDDYAECNLLCKPGCPAVTVAVNLSACQGDSVNYQGLMIAAGTIANLNLTSAAGCDSTVVITVAALPVPAPSQIIEWVCPGDSISINGNWLFAGDMDTITYNAFNGCDSVVYITVNEIPMPAPTSLTQKVCPGETYTFQGEVLSVGMSKTYTLQSFTGCDSTIILNIQAHTLSSYATAHTASCEVDPDGTLSVTTSGIDNSPYTFSIDGGATYQSASTFDKLQANDINVVIKDKNGCQHTEIVQIADIAALKAQLPDAILPCKDLTVPLQVTWESGVLTGVTWAWSNGDTTSLTSEVAEAGNVYVDISNACEQIRLEAKVEDEQVKALKDRLYVANAFSPTAANAANTTFCPLSGNDLTMQAYHFNISDRWGNAIYDSKTPTDCWDGRYKGKKLDPNVYVWMLEIKADGCKGKTEDFKLSGDVFLQN